EREEVERHRVAGRGDQRGDQPGEAVRLLHERGADHFADDGDHEVDVVHRALLRLRRTGGSHSSYRTRGDAKLALCAGWRWASSNEWTSTICCAVTSAPPTFPRSARKCRRRGSSGSRSTSGSSATAASASRCGRCCTCWARRPTSTWRSRTRPSARRRATSWTCWRRRERREKAEGAGREPGGLFRNVDRQHFDRVLLPGEREKVARLRAHHRPGERGVEREAAGGRIRLV